MTKQSPPPIATIGYEGSVVADVIAALRAAGVRTLIDVRAVAASRKPGFSKRQLAAELEAAGLAYIHLRALGTPKPGRDAVRRGDVATMNRIFGAHMEGDEPRAALAEATALARAGPVCLLCYEHDPAECHRTLLAERISAETGLPIAPLTPCIK